MPTSILTSKLQVPLLRPNLVQRLSLMKHLSEGQYRQVVLISAPAGFGKTTLASSWIAQNKVAATWLSLDQYDNDLGRFLAYLIASVQRFDSGIGQLAHKALQSNQQPATEAILTSLLNEIAAIPHDFWLVLDDYHLVASPEIDKAMSFLLEHLPRQMHVMMITRHVPQLPLARLRVRNQLTALDAAQLRFTLNEAVEFFNQTMGLALSVQDIKTLEERTEGWVAGLQLVALSLQGRLDTQDFIQAFTGSHRFVVDYLLEEVLQRQPADIREFLLYTSILDQLNGALCNAITARDDGQKTLEMLHDKNLFVIALDDRHSGYRYHHLFRDALSDVLTNQSPQLLPTLHQRASDYYTERNQLHEAIRHALLAENFEQAANLIEMTWMPMFESHQSDEWYAWASQIPEAIILKHPALCLAYGWVKLMHGDVDTAEVWFQRAERWLDAPSEQQKRMVISDLQQFEALPAFLHHARGYLALTLGDIPTALHYTEQSLKLKRHRHHINDVQGMVMCGLTYLANGDLIQANQILSDFIVHLETTQHISDATELVFIIGDIRITLGELRAAHQLYEHAFQFLEHHNNPPVIGIEDLYRGMADVYLVWHQLALAEESIIAADEIGKQGISRPNWLSRLYTTQARLNIAQGNLETALHLLGEAEQHMVLLPVLLKQPLSAMKAHVWIRQGKLDLAQRWAHLQGLSPQADITYLQEYDYVMLARLQLATYREQPSDPLRVSTHKLLARLQQMSADNKRHSHLIEVLILKALLYDAHQEPTLALDTLQQVLKLAELEGHIRPFVDEGQPMAHLLRRAANQHIMPNYTRRLLLAFDNPTSPNPTEQPLIEALSDREFDVLRLLHTDLSGPEIAHALFISLSTMRTHTRNIYSKLGVNNRRAAVRRATELALL